MTYDLALKLKNAGFPNSDLWYEDEHSGVKHFYPDASIQASVPTLEELISACGEVVLWPWHGKWYAGTPKQGEDTGSRSDIYYDEYPNPLVEGPTPSEAVANLWLALNENRKNQK